MILPHDICSTTATPVVVDVLYKTRQICISNNDNKNNSTHLSHTRVRPPLHRMNHRPIMGKGGLILSLSLVLTSLSSAAGFLTTPYGIHSAQQQLNKKTSCHALFTSSNYALYNWVTGRDDVRLKSRNWSGEMVRSYAMMDDR